MNSRKFISILSLVIAFTIQGCKSKIKSIELSELTIAKIHNSYASGEYNSEQLLVSYLDRINKKDENINSITYINPNAIEQAKKLDEEYSRTKILRPLHGIPILVKDNINTIGLPTTAGALALKENFSSNDAFIISKLKEAGAIVLGKTNMAEWAFTPWASFSSTNGHTFNPYNINYSPGGSSGGTGASIAANFGVVGLGTDTGNSIRGPSSHNMLVGFRPTMGLVSRGGIVPLILNQDIAGPMCRTVEDATRVLEIISGYDPNDPLTKHSEGKIPTNYVQFLNKDGTKGKRIGVLRNIGTPETHPEILELFNIAIKDLKTLGAEVVDSINIPNLKNLSKDLFCDDFRVELESYLAQNIQIDTLKTLEDIFRIGTKSKFTKSEILISMNDSIKTTHIEKGCLDVYSDPGKIKFRQAVENYMNKLNLDVLVYPTWNLKPYKIDELIEKYEGDNSAVIAPKTGQPAFTVPMGFTKNGLPTGIEFLGRMYSEATLIQIAYSYEQYTNHRKPPDVK